MSLARVEFLRVYPNTNKSLKPEDKVEKLNPVKNTKVHLICSHQIRSTLQNNLQGVLYCKLLPEGFLGFGLAEMYTSARNHPLVIIIPTVSFALENYWPVKVRRYSNGKTKWIYIHEDEPSVKSFFGEVRAMRFCENYN